MYGQQGLHVLATSLISIICIFDLSHFNVHLTIQLKSFRQVCINSLSSLFTSWEVNVGFQFSSIFLISLELFPRCLTDLLILYTDYTHSACMSDKYTIYALLHYNTVKLHSTSNQQTWDLDLSFATCLILCDSLNPL